MPRRERPSRRRSPLPLGRGLGRYRGLLPLLIVWAACGFVTVLGLHALAALRPGEPWGALTLLSVPFVFPPWFAVVVEANRIGLASGPQYAFGRGLSWSLLLRGLRPVERVLAWASLAAVVGVTIAGWVIRRDVHGEGVPSWVSLPAVAFYGIATFALLSAWHVPPEPEDDDPRDVGRRHDASE